MKIANNLLIIFFIQLTISNISCEVVCSEDELVRELQEDIEDNGKLDCLRESLPRSKNETPEEERKRVAANWDSDCSFESDSENSLEGNHQDYSWKTRLERIYGLTKGLVDVNGNPVENNQKDQADMCEIIRALVANNVFPKIGNDVTNINKDLVQFIDCPGEEGQTEVCAANSGSFADNDKWYIFLDGQSISFNGKPKYQPEKESAPNDESNEQTNQVV